MDAKTIAGLLGLIAHDLRNPLSALHSNVGFLAASAAAQDGEFREAVSDALVSCDGMIAIIDNIELFSQALVASPPRSVVPVRVASVVAETVATYRSTAQSHEVEIKVDASATDPSLQVMVHRDMYRRALANVLRNAIQLGAGHPVRVAAARVVAGHVQVLVTDRGPRLGAELRDEPFTAAGQLSVKTKTGGRYSRGLGLFCARFAAESAGAALTPAEPPPGARNALALTAPTP